MQAMLFDGTLRAVDDYPQPALAAGEAIIRPRLVGICNTDIEITRGYMGFRGVLGHEFVGTVVECADAAWLGRRVVGEINAACRSCPACLRGDAPHCPYRTTLGIDRRDGAMAERFSLPISCLHAVPERVPDSAAVFVEPLAAAVEILEQSHLRPTERVAVVGDGKLGLLIAQVLRLPGCDVTLVGRHPERWALLNELGVATMHTEARDTRHETRDKETTNAGASASAEAHKSSGLPISDLGSPGLPLSLSGAFDVVVDCTGQPGGLDTARRLVRPRGRLVLKSTFEGGAAFNLSMVVVDEIQIVGSRCGPFDAALRLLERRLVETEPLIAATYRLSEGLEAFAAARGQLKVLLAP
jgi:alcohol dehydrogenase